MAFKKSRNKNSGKYTIGITRAIDINFNPEIRNFIFKNSNYRLKVWNDFVEEYYRCKNEKIDFDVFNFKGRYFREIEKPNNIYKTYCSGISEQVMKDIMNGIVSSEITNGSLKFKKFDRYRCSFCVHSRANLDTRKDRSKGLPIFNSRVRLDGYDFVSFRASCGNWLQIKLKEPLFYDSYWNSDKNPSIEPKNTRRIFYDKKHRYEFSEADINEISFIHKLGKFYISLSVDVELTYDKRVESSGRIYAAGIDVGIRNPLYIKDNENEYVIKMTEKTEKRIRYLKRRISKLNSIMDRKYKTNLKNGLIPYSKNYEKVRKKLRISHSKIFNIRLDWRRKISCFIAKKYHKICIDNFNITKAIQKINNIYLRKDVLRKGLFYTMYKLMLAIKNACALYKTIYIESPPKSSRICSRCGYINPKSEVYNKYYECESCGFGKDEKVDRDSNAAHNCFIHACITK